MRKSNRYTKIRGYKNHPRADRDGGVFEQILVAEQALGRHLPRTAQVHHINGDTFNNEPSNLVICENQAYHRLLHKRAKAKKECGHADWDQCMYCKKYEPPGKMYSYIPNKRSTNVSSRHRECHSKQCLASAKKRKQKQLESGVLEAPYVKLHSTYQNQGK